MEDISVEVDWGFGLICVGLVERDHSAPQIVANGFSYSKGRLERIHDSVSSGKSSEGLGCLVIYPLAQQAV